MEYLCLSEGENPDWPKGKTPIGRRGKPRLAEGENPDWFEFRMFDYAVVGVTGVRFPVGENPYSGQHEGARKRRLRFVIPGPKNSFHLDSDFAPPNRRF
jgi:hypothetical protein